MKKLYFVLLAFVPMAFGYVMNYSVRVSFLINIFYYILSPAMLVFWFFIGKNYSKTKWNWVKSVLISHWLGFVSIALYIWQFYFVSDEARNTLLAGFSQMYTSCTYFISVKIAALFYSEYNNTKVVMTLMQIIGLILMVIIFTLGYLYGKKKEKSKSANT